MRERRASVPDDLDHIVHRCLQKEPEARWQSMIDITHQLRWVATVEERQPARVTRSPWTCPAAYAAVLILAIAAAAAVSVLRKPSADVAPPLHLTLLPPADLTLTPFASSGAPHFALSPDGERIAFVASAVGQPPSLWVRRLDSRAAQQIPQSHDAFAPFWFPDGESLGFFAEARFKTIRLDGERPSVRGPLLDAAGGTSNGDVILLATGGPILKTPVAGGPLVPVTVIEGESGGHRWPQFLPDGRRFIYTQSRGSVMLASLDSTTTARLLTGRATAVYDRDGWLLFSGASAKLMGQAVDTRTLEPTGAPREVLDGIRYAPGAGFPPVSLSARGVLAYWDGTTVATVIEWFDRQGKELALPAPPAANTFVIAPDGRQVAFSRGDGRGDGEPGNTIWLIDAAGNASRFSYIPDAASQPHWSADGRHLLFVSRASGVLSLFRRLTSGIAKEQLIGTIAGGRKGGGAEFVEVYVGDWSRDQDTIVFSGARQTTGWASSLPRSTPVS